MFRAPHPLGCVVAAGPSCGPHPCKLLAVAGEETGDAARLGGALVSGPGPGFLHRLAGRKGRTLFASEIRV